MHLIIEKKKQVEAIAHTILVWCHPVMIPGDECSYFLCGRCLAFDG